MAEFKVALDAFLRGDLDSGGLEQALVQALAAQPGEAPALLALLREPYRAGRLPQQLYTLLENRITPVLSGAGQPAGGGAPADADRTRVTPPPADADRTQIRGPATGAAPDDADRTRVAPHPPADADRTQVRGPATAGPTDDAERTRVTMPPQGGSATGASHTSPTGANTGTGTTGSTGGSSGWSDFAAAAGETEEPLKVGDVLKGRFVLETVIGRGGMGVVFKARDLRKEEAQDRNPYVAVKVLNEQFKRHPESLKALQREARKAQNLAHPNIVNVFDFDRDGTNVYMTMEFLDGEPLDKVIRQGSGRGLPEAEALALVDGMGQALAYAHKKGVVHSDFKPGNAFLNEDGVVKVFDFGIARATKHAGTSEGETTLFDAGSLGALTPAYASCEMLDGEEPDARDDIYALACTAYELLTGRHPFNKLPANQARDQKLVPEPVKGLSRRQWRGLLRGLAFDRAARSPDVEHFLDDLRRRRTSKWVMIGGAVGVIVIVALAATFIPDYLHNRRIGRIIAELRSGDDQAVARAIAALHGLPAADQTSVAQDAREPIIAYYQRRVDAAIDAGQGHYDYPEAERLLQTAKTMYPDSAAVQNVIAQVQSRKNQLVNDLNTRFNTDLETGRLLPSPDHQDLSSVLDILAKVDPKQPLLTDPRIPDAFVQQAQKAADAKDYDRAGKLLTAGLQRFPKDLQLVNLRDQLRAEIARAQRRALVTQLSERLAANLSTFRTLDDIAAQRQDITQLQQLKPDAPVLAHIQKTLRDLLDTQISQLVAARKWSDATDLLQKYADLLPSDYQQAKQQQVADAQQTHDQLVQKIFADINKAATDHRLAPPAKDNATALLQQLQQAGADPTMVQQARASIAQAYLDLARQARGAGKWDAARHYVQQGLAQQGGDTIAQSLQAEQTEIGRAQQAQQQKLATAEQEKLQKQQQAQIDQLHQQFSSGLAEPQFTIARAQALLKVLDQLAAVQPTDPLLSKGRDQIAQRLAAEAQALGKAGQWDQAVALSRQAINVIPGSDLLTGNLNQIRLEQAAAQQAQRAQTLQQHEQAVDALIAQPRFDDAWQAKLDKEIQAVGGMVPAKDPWLTSRRQQLGSLYLQQAAKMREAQRFAEAVSMLDRARTYAPDLAGLTAEQQAIQTAQAKFEAQAKAQAQQAQIAGRKQTLLTQARANDVRAAKQTLDTLRGELPAGDPFLTDTGPKAIGSAYLRLAEGVARRHQYSAALQLLQAGQAIAPQMSELNDAVQRFTLEAKVYDMQKTFAAATTLDTAALGKDLAAIRDAAGKQYGQVEKDLAAALAKRIEKLQGSDYKAAERMLSDGRKLFPGSRELAGVKLTAPAPQVAAPTAPAKPTTTTTTAPPVTGAVKDRCTPNLAGYGRIPRATCSDELPGKVDGPVMVIVPAGGGFSAPFAISKYEISVGNYNDYCRASGSCRPISGVAKDLPVTNISFKDAEAYAAWLTKVTGFKYSIPTDKQWTYAAQAGGAQPDKDFNCTLRIGSSVVRGLSLVGVKTGKPNGWGLVNYVGNAQEWVRTGNGIAARGGDYEDSMSNCDISLSRPQSGGPDKVTGFRLVRQVRGGG